MSESRVIPLRRPPRVVEGTPAEIEEQLRMLSADQMLTLIIPDEREVSLDSLLAPLQADFEASGMREDELDELIDSEIRASRQERSTRRPQPDA